MPYSPTRKAAKAAANPTGGNRLAAPRVSAAKKLVTYAKAPTVTASRQRAAARRDPLLTAATQEVDAAYGPALASLQNDILREQGYAAQRNQAYTQAGQWANIFGAHGGYNPMNDGKPIVTDPKLNTFMGQVLQQRMMEVAQNSRRDSEKTVGEMRDKRSQLQSERSGEITKSLAALRKSIEDAALKEQALLLDEARVTGSYRGVPTLDAIKTRIQNDQFNQRDATTRRGQNLSHTDRAEANRIRQQNADTARYRADIAARNGDSAGGGKPMTRTQREKFQANVQKGLADIPALRASGPYSHSLHGLRQGLVAAGYSIPEVNAIMQLQTGGVLRGAAKDYWVNIARLPLPRRPRTSRTNRPG